MRIRLETGQPSCYLVVAENGQSILIQNDTDFPGVATSFGWIACHCGETDGTIDCPHASTAEFISAARGFLDERIGAVTDDPGYFSG
jgi:hypothetical protein